MAQVYCTGPIPIWLGVGIGTSGPLFLGHAEKMPRIQIRPHHSPVFVDLGGQGVPFDEIYDGEEAIVTADVSRFNEATYAVIADRANARLNASIRGFDAPGDIGTLMVQDGIAYNMWLPFPYSAKASQASLPAGYHFVAAHLIGPDELDPLGTAGRKIRMVWHCLRLLDLSATNNFGQGNLTLYNHDMSRIAGLAFN